MFAMVRDNGVKVVVMSFVGKDNEMFRDLQAEADKAGLIIVAPISNSVSKDMQYPAAYKQNISVAADNENMPLRKDANLSKWVCFSTDGSLPIRSINGKNDYGSSFAAARMAGVLAVIDFITPIQDSNDARKRLTSFSGMKYFSVGPEKVSIPYVNISKLPDLFNNFQKDIQTPGDSRSENDIANLAYYYQISGCASR